MPPVRINDRIAVMGQPRLDDFAALKAQGFTTVINNRPDGEAPGQPGSAAEEAAAHAAGLDYHYLPVTGATLNQEAVTRFADLVAAAPGPVLAHCAGGLRSAMLHTLGEVRAGRLAPQDVMAEGARIGFDLSPALGWLQRNGRA
ncbi:TIGR01244 family sulfur transferase [Zavarzinia sp. CC-PAN008]|uniref:TIGR01244 family sulfur transferase n=1 Tax=Zavarzinia sp. CC-PAN008 TaxID=3243332 RepID=UPI003F7448E7